MNAQVSAKVWDEFFPSDHGIWLVEIDHTAKLNAMTRQMWGQLREVFQALNNDPAVRCIVVQGVGEAFCAGGDISEYPGFRFESASLEYFHEQEVWGGLSAMLACDVPIIANIRGACMGAGVEIACCCDVRLVADNARFGAPIAKLGFPMAPKELQLIAASVGAHTAQRMLLEAAVFSAHDLAAWGWCTSPVTMAQWQPQLQRTVLRIATLAPQAARLNKQTLRALRQGQSIAHPYAYASSAEHREGITAFLEKRQPHF